MTTPTPERIMEVGLGFWSSKVLLSAIELGLFTELAKEPADLEGLRARLGLHLRVPAERERPDRSIVNTGIGAT